MAHLIFLKKSESGKIGNIQNSIYINCENISCHRTKAMHFTTFAFQENSFSNWIFGTTVELNSEKGKIIKFPSLCNLCRLQIVDTNVIGLGINMVRFGILKI